MGFNTKGMKIRLLTLSLVLSTVLFLSGCETFDDVMSNSPVLDCPKVRLSPDVIRKVIYREGDGRDLIDIDQRIDVLDLRLACGSEVDRKTFEGFMEVDATLIFRVSRGPANIEGRANFTYFLAITDQANRILYRETFGIARSFPPNLSRIVLESDPITIELPLKAGQSPKTYEFIGGLQLTRDQLEDNRRELKEQL